MTEPNHSLPENKQGEEIKATSTRSKGLGLKKKFKLFKSNQKGLNPILLILYVAIGLAILIGFSSMTMFGKGRKAGEYSGFFNQIQSVSSTIESVKDKSKILYGGVIADTAPNFRQTFYAPSVSAYVQSQTNVVNGEVASTGGTLSEPTAARSISIDNAGKLTLTEKLHYQGITKKTPSTYTIYDSFNSPVKSTTPISSYNPNGIHFLTPLSEVDVPDLTKHLFLGLLGGNSTLYGRNLESGDHTGLGKDSTSPTVGSYSVPSTDDSFGVGPILSVAFGNSATRFQSSTIQDSWFNLAPINSEVLLTMSDLGENFLTDQSKYRLFYVTKVANEDNAKRILARAFGVSETALNNFNTDPIYTAKKDAFENFMEVYYSAVKSLKKDTVVAVPVNESVIVYSEKSDYKYYAFSLND